MSCSAPLVTRHSHVLKTHKHAIITTKYAMKPTPDHIGKKIALRVKAGYRIIRCEDIIRCQAAGNYTNIFLANGQEISICKRLKEVEGMLPTDMFCRVHQSHLVNVVLVEMWIKDNGDFLLLKGGMEVPVARQRKNMIKEKLKI